MRVENVEQEVPPHVTDADSHAAEAPVPAELDDQSDAPLPSADDSAFDPDATQTAQAATDQHNPAAGLDPHADLAQADHPRNKHEEQLRRQHP